MNKPLINGFFRQNYSDFTVSSVKNQPQSMNWTLLKKPFYNSDFFFIWDLFINDFYHEKNGIISKYFAFALHLINQGTLGFLTAEGEFFFL